MEKVKWYTIATCVWIFIFPVTGITAWAFMISGPLVIVAAFIKFLFKVLGINLAWLVKSSFNLGIFTELILSIVVGVLLTIVGLLLWKVTKRIYRWLNSLKPNNRYN